MPLSNSISINSAAFLARTRKAGAGAPFGILSSLTPTLWLDATQIGGKSDGDSITTFPDSSGNGNDFGSGSNVLYKVGAHGAVVRNSLGGTLASTSTMATYITASDYTVWLAGVVNTGVGAGVPTVGDPAYNYGAFIADGTGDSSFAVTAESDGNVRAYGYSGGNHGAYINVGVGTFFTAIILHTGGTISISINGGTPVSTSLGNTVTNLTPHLFKNFSNSIQSLVDIGELGICNYALGVGLNNSLNSYLIAKWAP